MMAAPFLPGLDLEEAQGWAVQEASPTRQRRREPRSRSRKPATEINFLAQLEQREFQPGRDEMASYDEVEVQEEPKSKPEPSKRSGGTTGKRSKPEAAAKAEGASKRIRPPAKRAKVQAEAPPAAQRQQKGVLLIRPQPKTVRGKGASAVGPDPAAGDDSATESEGEMARRALRSSLPEQGGAAAAGRSSSSTSHTVSSSGNREIVNDAAREQGLQERKKLLKAIAATFRDECVLVSRRVLAYQRQWKQELQTPHPGLGSVTTFGDDGAKGQAPKSRARDKRPPPPSARKKPASRTIVTYDPTRNRIAEV